MLDLRVLSVLLLGVSLTLGVFLVLAPDGTFYRWFFSSLLSVYAAIFALWGAVWRRKD
jgi:hypothetical protein